MILEWATYRLGGTWIGIPTLERDLKNLEQLLGDFEPTLLFLEPGALGLYQVRTLATLQTFPCAEAEPPPHLDPARFRLLRRRIEGRSGFTVGGEPVVRIRYTSGATGNPKAIAYTERTIAAILDNILKLINPTEEETVVHGLPSVWASGSLIAPAFCRGGKNVLLPKWDLSRFVEAVSAEERVLTFLVPSQVADLAQYSEQNGEGWARNLGRVLVAGGPAPISTMRRAKNALPDVHFFITLGQTEASFPITFHEVTPRDVDSVQNRHPFVPLGPLQRPYGKSTVDPKTGELMLRGNAVAAGEWNRGLTTGLVPLVWSGKEPAEVLKAYVGLYLKEEVQMEGLVRRFDSFARFLESVSFSHAAVLNVSEVARECQVSRKTVEGFLEILEDLLLAFQIQVFTKRAQRSLSAHPKFFWFDAGVFAALRPAGPLDRPEEIAGAALEGLVAQHLRAWIDYSGEDYNLSFWRTKAGREVDFVVYGQHGFWAIEVKHSATVRPADLRGLKAFREDYPEAELRLLYRGRDAVEMDGVLCLPCDAFLRGLVPGQPLP